MKITSLAALIMLSGFTGDVAWADPPAADPTLPSAKIKQRLNRAEPTVTETITTERNEIVLPTVVLKAIVLTDRDHGSALIESGGRKFILPLSRDAGQRMNGFTVGGVSMVVEDFTSSSLLIRCGKQTFLVR